MTTLYLLRHGQASFGQADYDRLSELGQQQAAILGEHLAQRRIELSACYSGQLQRQRVTGELALARMPAARTRVQIDAAFDEYDADGVFRTYLPRVVEDQAEFAAVSRDLSRDRRQFQKVFAAVIQAWADDSAGGDGLESFPAFLERVAAGLNRLRERHGKHENIAVFTSGGVIAAAMRLVLGLNKQTMFDLNWRIANASLSEIHLRPHGLYLHGFNATAHLQAQGAKYLTYR